ncbi:hypothetical protein BD626DRAFT_119554 [Schizophyllum amplum]|uniref:Uncharacterized protein n=1 Tax=Schizophyllum amplum TaxID=97359 RepID=A0A550CV45_9AGAR|nr:hypothetical protein BD626DRAFT_119554 [Auriculariopsis ampla]
MGRHCGRCRSCRIGSLSSDREARARWARHNRWLSFVGTILLSSERRRRACGSGEDPRGGSHNDGGWACVHRGWALDAVDVICRLQSRLASGGGVVSLARCPGCARCCCCASSDERRRRCAQFVAPTESHDSSRRHFLVAVSLHWLSANGLYMPARLHCAQPVQTTIFGIPFVLFRTGRALLLRFHRWACCSITDDYEERKNKISLGSLLSTVPSPGLLLTISRCTACQPGRDRCATEKTTYFSTLTLTALAASSKAT